MAPQGKRSRPGASPSTDFQGRRTSVCLCRKRRGVPTPARIRQGRAHHPARRGGLSPPAIGGAAHTTRREGAGGQGPPLRAGLPSSGIVGAGFIPARNRQSRAHHPARRGGRPQGPPLRAGLPSSGIVGAGFIPARNRQSRAHHAARRGGRPQGPPLREGLPSGIVGAGFIPAR